MSESAAGKSKGRAFDPVFVIMLVAVVLAVATSIVLRVAVGAGPSKARADDDSPFVHHASTVKTAHAVTPPAE